MLGEHFPEMGVGEGGGHICDTDCSAQHLDGMDFSSPVLLLFQFHTSVI